MRHASDNLRAGYNELMASGEIQLSEDQYREFSQTVVESATRMMALINDILDLSRIEAGCIRLELAPVQVAAVLNDALQELRPLADARVSTPLHWHEVPGCEPADFTVLTIPKRFAELGDAHADIDAAPGSLEKLLDLAARDEAEGLGDAPWPPHFRKMEGEARRVAPSRAKSATKEAGTKPARTKMPLVVVANSQSKDAALAGLEKWKSKHTEVAKLLAVDDVLVDSMRGRSSTWTRIRVNLRHVPEELRPPQETPDPDDDPTREWRSKRASKKNE